MSSKKQTAVEWLVEQMNWDFCYDSTQKIIEQAKAMEKEQIIDASTWGALHESAQQYYQHHYGS